MMRMKSPFKFFKSQGCLSLAFFLIFHGLFASQAELNDRDSVKWENFRMVFYNVENLFDITNDPLKNDDEFTPAGDRRWNYRRLQNKLGNLSKAIAAAGEWSTPSIIGLCEVENSHVLSMLTRNSALRNAGYEFVHRNSPDSRGIDVAILYRPGEFMLLSKSFTGITFPFDTAGRTRDILYVTGIAGGDDTLHIFVNHWPSRWGGQAATEPYRIYAARVLKSLADSVFLVNPMAKIVIMGDFNDEPGDKSLKEYLGAGIESDMPVPGKLYNMSLAGKNNPKGSYKYQGTWFMFDQFIVSGSLLTDKVRLQTSPGMAMVFMADFLMVPDKAWYGYKPFRTYEGFRHSGGFSDHLPVILDLWWYKH
jgi:predicted extracellular nuclease